MAKLADAIAEQHRSKGPRCGVALLLSRKDIAADLRAALADESVPCTAISRGLSKLGHSVSPHSLQRHRRGDCSCR